jgi:hypothetical protein
MRTRGVMSPSRRLGLLWFALVLAGSGCADKRVALAYRPDSTLVRATGTSPVTVFQFSDRRGSEGDNNPYRVGGVYGGYGNRLSKVMSSTPFAQTLAQAIATGFKARGIDATVVADREFSPSVEVRTPFALAGEIDNFSSEARFTTVAHISGKVRLYWPQGKLLLEKTISERETWGLGAVVFMSEDTMESVLNKALSGFVLKVVMDPDISAHLVAPY